MRIGIQRPGAERPRCGSFASSGLPPFARATARFDARRLVVGQLAVHEPERGEERDADQ
jgi:hypothetical protein